MPDQLQNTDTVSPFGYKEELRRALTLFDLLVYGLMLITPTAPFTTFGFIFNESGGMVPLVYVIGLLSMLLTALSYMTMAREFPLAGSVYAYARASFGENIGFIAGWALMLDYLLGPALIYIGAGVAIASVVPGVPLAVWGILLLAINTGVNLMGIESVAKANICILVLQLLAVGLFAAFGVVAVAKGVSGAHWSSQPFIREGQVSSGLLFGAVSLGVLNYVGFDAISTLSEEAKGGGRSVAIATLLALIAGACLFIGQGYLASLFVLKKTAFAPGFQTYAAFYGIAGEIGGAWFKAVLVFIGVVVANIAAALAAQAAVSRLIFSMGRDGKLPRALAHVGDRSRVPDYATLLVGLVTAGLILVFSGQLMLLVTIVSFGALTGFLFLHASVVAEFAWRRRSGRWVRHLVVPALGFAILAYVISNISLHAKVVGICWLLVGGCLLVFGHVRDGQGMTMKRDR